ncbi:MAG TPA: serine/threonine-protein kinase [Anaerolineaceae bacterium]
MADFSGKSIGRYQVRSLLGEGGMAAVYRAFDSVLDCEVAIKFIRTEELPPASIRHTLKRFSREAHETARLNHPNIVGIKDYGEYEGTPYLVMEYIPGGTLKDSLDEKVLFSPQEAAKLLAPIARALEFAHSKGIIHRDVKPGNILVTETNQPVLSDFGIAKIMDDGVRSTMTGTGVGLGTAAYMAPEQWRGKPEPASDQYSLGVVLYELVTGNLPFSSDTPGEMMYQHTTQPPPSPRSFVPTISEDFERVIYRVLEKDPARRFESMEAFAQVLDQMASDPHFSYADREKEGRPIDNEVVPPADSTGIKKQTSGEQSQPLAAARHPKTKILALPRWLLIPGAAILIIAAFAGLFFALNPAGTISKTGTVIVSENFENPNIWTYTNPTAVVVSGGKAIWNIDTSKGKQYIYRSIPKFSGNFRMTLVGQVNYANNNCGSVVTLGDQDFSKTIGVGMGFYGGGCPVSGFTVIGPATLWDYFYSDGCGLNQNWLWIEANKIYTTVLEIKNGMTTMTVKGQDKTVVGKPVYTGEYNTLYVGYEAAGDYPTCSGSFDSVIIEKLP